MANEIHLQTIFQVKRGLKARWEELNPVLRQGEPGFVIDANILKIGDGATAWNDLPTISGVSGMETVQTRSELPTEGDISVIYRIVDEKVLCQYNLNSQSYEDLTAAAVKIKVNDVELTANEDGSITIPNAMLNAFGLIKGTKEVDIINGEIKSISTDLLVQGEEDILLVCGDHN